MFSLNFGFGIGMGDASLPFSDLESLLITCWRWLLSFKFGVGAVFLPGTVWYIGTCWCGKSLRCCGTGDWIEASWVCGSLGDAGGVPFDWITSSNEDADLLNAGGNVDSNLSNSNTDSWPFSESS